MVKRAKPEHINSSKYVKDCCNIGAIPGFTFSGNRCPFLKLPIESVLIDGSIPKPKFERGQHNRNFQSFFENWLLRISNSLLKTRIELIWILKYQKKCNINLLLNTYL